MLCRFSLLWLLSVIFLSISSNAFRPPVSYHRLSSKAWTRRGEPASWVVCRVQPSNDDGDEEGNKTKDAVPEKKSLEKTPPVPEPYQSQEEAEQKTFNRLLLPQRIGEIFNRSVYAVGIVFVLSSIALNFFGYSYVVRDGHLDIDTLEARQFADEINRPLLRKQAGKIDE